MTQTTSIAFLIRKRDNALRRAEMVGRALERFDRPKEHRKWINAYHRRRLYLNTVANLTLAIEAVRLAESKEVKVFGSLSA